MAVQDSREEMGLTHHTSLQARATGSPCRKLCWEQTRGAWAWVPKWLWAPVIHFSWVLRCCLQPLLSHVLEKGVMRPVGSTPTLLNEWGAL